MVERVHTLSFTPNRCYHTNFLFSMCGCLHVKLLQFVMRHVICVILIFYFSPVEAENYEIQAGHKWRGYGSTRRVSKIIVHELFNRKTGDYDIAVVKVSKPFKLGKRKINAAVLPTAGSKPTEGALATVSGWGVWFVLIENFIEIPALHLRAVKVPIIDKKKCQHLYRNYHGGEKFTERQVCSF